MRDNEFKVIYCCNCSARFHYGIKCCKIVNGKDILEIYPYCKNRDTQRIVDALELEPYVKYYKDKNEKTS